MSEQEKGPQCGKFMEIDADGFYARLDPDDDMGEVLQFCNEECADKAINRQRGRQRGACLVSPRAYSTPSWVREYFVRQHTDSGGDRRGVKT